VLSEDASKASPRRRKGRKEGKKVLAQLCKLCVALCMQVRSGVFAVGKNPDAKS
jgi:hypothetical protein